MLADEIKGIMDCSLEMHEVPFSEIAISKNNRIFYQYRNGNIEGNELYFLYKVKRCNI